MSETIDPKPLRAADVFGGKDALTERVAVMIHATREARGYTEADLAVKAQEGNAADVTNLENRTKLPTANVLMAYLDALGLPLQNVMKIESLDDTDMGRWSDEMLRRKVMLMARANGPDPVQAATPEHKRWALELFLRIEALNEICSKAQTTPGMEGRAARLRNLVESF
jgi:transcriptional regulator with XRE-family HTH domain